MKNLFYVTDNKGLYISCNPFYSYSSAFKKALKTGGEVFTDSWIECFSSSLNDNFVIHLN